MNVMYISFSFWTCFSKQAHTKQGQVSHPNDGGNLVIETDEL